MIGCDRHSFGYRDLSLGPPLVLHIDREGGDRTLARAALGQYVRAVALEVKGGAIKGYVMWVPGHMASPSPLGSKRVACLDAIDQPAFLVWTTGRTMAFHDSTHLAYTLLLAEPVDIERIPSLIIEALVDAATLGDGNTLVTAQDKAFIAFTSLVALGSTRHRIEEAATCHGTVAGTHFVVAICGAVRLAKVGGSPLINLDPSCLASCRVGGQNVTDGILVALIGAVVKDTVSEV